MSSFSLHYNGLYLFSATYMIKVSETVTQFKLVLTVETTPHSLAHTQVLIYPIWLVYILLVSFLYLVSCSDWKAYLSYYGQKMF